MRGRGIVAGLFALLGVISSAGQAQADQHGFITHIDNMGVSYKSIADMMEVGRAVCHELRSGQAPPVVLGRLQRVGFAPAESAIVLTAAVDNMCLDTKAGVVSWAASIGQRVPV